MDSNKTTRTEETTMNILEGLNRRVAEIENAARLFGPSIMGDITVSQRF
jgi:hypothetical protein